MTETPTRKTQARIAERKRQQAQEARTKNLKRALPLIVAGVIAVVALAYFVVAGINPFVRPTITGTIGPRLQVDREQMDLGDEKLGQTVRAQFTLKNMGDGTLVLGVPKMPTVVQGCCPSDIVVGQTTLQPGESTTLYTDMMMHEGMGGKHLFEIPLTTNDPTQQAMKLSIASNWVP